MKLARIVWISTFVVFVGTLPHAVGAMFFEAPQVVRKSIKVQSKDCYVSVAYMKKLAKRIGRQQVMEQYKSKREWYSLFTLWNQESRWDYTANNRHSTAYGIPQMLDMPEDTPLGEQITLGLNYIEHRYGSPTRALAFHTRNGWY